MKGKRLFDYNIIYYKHSNTISSHDRQERSETCKRVNLQPLSTS